MLLSPFPRSRTIGKGLVVCAHCHSPLRPQNMQKQNPSKFAIANGFAKGEFPKEILRHNSKNIRKADVEKLTDETRALFATNAP